jgi:hypothetical protein
LHLARSTMASSLSPNRSSPELQALKKSIFDHEDYPFILSILSSKKKWMAKEKKIRLLKKFIETTNGGFIGAHQEFYDLVLTEVKHSGRNVTNERKQWNHSYMGEKLTVLYLLYGNFVDTTNDENRRATRGGTVTFFKGLHFQIKELLDKALAEEAIQASKGTRTSLNFQKTGNRVQDRIEFDVRNVDLEPCPSCNHMCTMTVQSKLDVDNINDQALQEHNRKLVTWEHLPLNQRGTKPRAPTTTSEQVACYCVKSHCLLSLDGGQCYNCKDFAAECAGTDGGFLQEDVNGKLTCPCNICECSCQITFKQHDRRKIAMAQAQATAGLPSIEAQSTVGYFNGVIDSHLQNGSISARQGSGVSEEQARSDAAAFASLGILADPNIQNNTLLRKNLQAACGPRPQTTKDGVSIDVLRRRHGSLPSTAATTTLMPPPPPMNAVATRNSRFFRNGLKGTPAEMAAQLTSKKQPPGHQVLPPIVKESASNFCDLMSPPAVSARARAQTIDIHDDDSPPVPAHALTIDILDDDASVASVESLSLEDKVQARKTRMRLISRKRLVDGKGDWENGKPTEEQKEDFARKKAAHLSLTKDTPLKSVDTAIRDSLHAHETTPQAMDFLMLLEKIE